MKWLEIVKALLPVIIQIMESIYPKGGGVKKRAAAVAALQVPVRAAGLVVPDEVVGKEVDKKVAAMRVSGELA